MNGMMTREQVRLDFARVWYYAYGLASWAWKSRHDEAARLFRVPEWDHAKDISMPGLSDPFFIGVK